MANDIIPMVTNLAASGKVLNLSAGIEFDVGAHGGDGNRTPIVALAIADMAYDQMIPFQIDIEAAQKGVNLWEAPSEALRARAIIVECLYGAGGILINPDGDPLPFPLASDGTVPSFFMYANPEGTSLIYSRIAIAEEGNTWTKLVSALAEAYVTLNRGGNSVHFHGDDITGTHNL